MVRRPVMKALVAPELGRLELADVPAQPIGPGQVLVKTMVSGVSAGTEKRKLFTAELGPNDVRGPWPAVGAFGYMASGTVIEIGEGVEHVAPGDRVFAGRAWGGHRELIDAAASSVVRLPDGLDWVEAACSYWGVPPLLGMLAAEPAFYEDAAVVGLGPLGLMGVQLLGRLSRRVVGLDTVTVRCQLARSLGATAAFDPRTAGLAAAVQDVLPRGPQVVLEVSGTQPGLETALSIVRPRGRVALVGSQQRLDRFDLFWPLQISGARIVPIFREGEDSPQSSSGSPVARHLPKIQEMLVRGWLRIEPLISWVVPPEVAPRAMDLLHRRPDLGVGMAIAWDESQVRNVDGFERAWSEDAAGSR